MKKQLKQKLLVFNIELAKEIGLMNELNKFFHRLVNSDVDVYGEEIKNAFNSLQDQYEYLKPILECIVETAEISKTSMESHEKMLKDMYAHEHDCGAGCGDQNRN